MRLRKNVFGVISSLFAIACAYDAFNLEPNEPQWLSVFNVTKRPHSVVIGVENETTVTFKNSLIKSLHRDHSVMIVEGEHMPEPETERIFLRILIRKANLILNINNINSSLLDKPILKFMLRSQLSVLFIMVSTQDRLYECDRGNFSEEAHAKIEIFLNDLWHKYRILIVILALPNVCPNEYVIYGNTKSSHVDLYNRTIKLINTTIQLSRVVIKRTHVMLTRNYPLKGNMFNRFPTSITNCSGTEAYLKTSDILGDSYCGMDALVMADVVQHFKFNLSMPRLEPAYDKFGYQQEDGVITGSLGLIFRGDFDISFNSRFMVTYIEGCVWPYHFLYPISQDSLCALLKHPDEQPLWRYPYKAYTLTQWLCIYTALISVGVFMWVSARIKKRLYHNIKASSLYCYVTNSINAGLFGFFLVRRNDLLILRGACLYASIMLLALYQSYINYTFTTRWYKPMNKLSDLVEANTVILTSPSINALVEIPSNDVQATLRARTVVSENTNFYDYVHKHRNMAAIERHTDAILWTLMEYKGEDGRPQLYVANECFREFYLSYITNRAFPFVELLHVFMMRLVESGLPDMYYTWTSRSRGLDVTLPSMTSEPRIANRITISAQVIPFSLLFIGYLLSTVALVVELWMAKRTKLFPYLP